jgi:hypothetical protein
MQLTILCVFNLFVCIHIVRSLLLELCAIAIFDRKLRYHVLRIDTSSLDYMETAESTSTLGSIRIDAFTAFVNATPAEAGNLLV